MHTVCCFMSRHMQGMAEKRTCQNISTFHTMPCFLSKQFGTMACMDQTVLTEFREEESEAYIYGKCSKILNTNCLQKKPRQTGQTQIRLLLQKQSDQGLPYLLL